MAERTTAEKLQVKTGDRVRVSGAGAAGPSDGAVALIGALPSGAEFVDSATTRASAADVILVFVRTRSELLDSFAADLAGHGSTRAVWYCYPKGGRADLNRDTIMRESGAFGWRPISNISLGDTWSAVRIRPLADGEAPVG